MTRWDKLPVFLNRPSTPRTGARIYGCLSASSPAHLDLPAVSHRFWTLHGHDSEFHGDNVRSFVALQRVWQERTNWRPIALSNEEATDVLTTDHFLYGCSSPAPRL